MITKSRKRAKSRMGHGLVGESGSGMGRKHFRTNDVFTAHFNLPTSTDDSGATFDLLPGRAEKPREIGVLKIAHDDRALAQGKRYTGVVLGPTSQREPAPI
jgi:hypothetical protein